ncbi:MAG TPA: hypothetical protein VGI43_10505 [Mucilaginibacter sp.]
MSTPQLARVCSVGKKRWRTRDHVWTGHFPEFCVNVEADTGLRG